MDGVDDKRRTVTVSIEGRVQGVSYRAWTERTATALGLDGTVRNMNDGSVEAVFSGPSEAVAEMIERCRQGPRHAAVTSVMVQEEGSAPPRGFRILASG